MMMVIFVYELWFVPGLVVVLSLALVLVGCADCAIAVPPRPVLMARKGWRRCRVVR